ncbi:MAG TPA: carboxypeptidase regulatory-like domain-containing protein [Thermoanaerobaculia bacterium]|jgi:tetratricopeptide (TPR) repeat protein|nr:carboxypeptidase regulatory-like domain-containing protein [Thermoanaerobaculia bacterium]
MRHAFLRIAAVAAALFLAASSPLFGGTQGRIVGVVTDGAGKPLEGVKVTVTTPALGNFKVELKTDKAGKWGTILNDATIKYHYKFEKEGFLAVEEDKKVPVASTENLDIQLLNKEQAVAKGVVKEVADPFTAAFNEAVDKSQAGDLDAALAKAEEAIKIAPEKGNGYELATKIAARKKDWQKTIQYGEKSLSIEPDNPGLFPILAQAYRDTGNKEKAKEYDKKNAAANPDDPTILYNQAVDLYNKNDFKGAAPILAKILEAKPDMAQAHFLLGMCDVNLNKIPDMKKHLSEYIKLDPNGKDVGTAKEMLDAFK